MTDFNLSAPGETSNKLLMLVQDIETIMTASRLDIITNGRLEADIEQYLFKQGLDVDRISTIIEQKIQSGATNLAGFDIQVQCTLMTTEQVRDLLFVQIRITANSVEQTMLEYAVTKDMQARTSNNHETI